MALKLGTLAEIPGKVLKCGAGEGLRRTDVSIV
jgi:hypothetical protein